jgi:hypothetical protein
MLCGPASGEGAPPRFYSVWVPLSRAHTINVAAAGGSGGAVPLRVRPGECAVLASNVRYCHTCGWGGLGGGRAGARAARDAPLLLWCAQFSPAPVLAAEGDPSGAARRRSPTPVALAVPCAAKHPALRPAPRGGAAGAPLSARNGVRVLLGSAREARVPFVSGAGPGAEPGPASASQFLPLARPGDCALVRGLEWHCRCESAHRAPLRPAPPRPAPPRPAVHV